MCQLESLICSSQTQSMDRSNGLLPASLLLVSLLVVLSVSASEEQGGELESRFSDVVRVERRPDTGSAHTQVILSI